MPGCRRTRPTAVFVHSRLRKKITDRNTDSSAFPNNLPKLYHIFSNVSIHISKVCQKPGKSNSSAARKRPHNEPSAILKPFANAFAAANALHIRGQSPFYYSVRLLHNVRMALLLRFRSLSEHKISRFKNRWLRPLHKYYLPLTPFYHLRSLLFIFYAWLVKL